MAEIPGGTAACSRSSIKANSIMTVLRMVTLKSGAPPLMILEKIKSGEYVTIRITELPPKYYDYN